MTDRASGPIFVTGVWKSGNHLVYSALNQLGISGPFNGFAAHLLFGRGKVLKRLLRGGWPMKEHINVGLETEARIRPSYLRSSLRRLRGSIIGGHAAYSEAFLTLLRQEGARIITIRRDPRDVLVSFADWIGDRPDYFAYPDFVSLTREERIARLLRGGPGSGYTLAPFSEILERAQPWLAAGDDVLPVAFEDLIGPNGGGSRVQQEQALTAICVHLGLTPPAGAAWVDRIYGNSLTFNRGQVQRWRKLQSRDLQHQIEDHLKAHLPVWGYTA